MTNDQTAANLQWALDWTTQVVAGSLSVHFQKADQFEAPDLRFCDDESWLAQFIRRQGPNSEEFAVLMLALAPHLQPDFFSKLIVQYLPEGGDLPEFGGVKGGN